VQWETVIGLEIHAQLSTNSKIFSGASTAFGSEPNTQACAVDLGLPGVLPVLNGEVVHMAIRFAIATGASIGKRSVFARKNYFYPDLPKGYQISQMALPIVGNGSVDIVLEDGASKVVGLTRAHLEEDAGKSLHEEFSDQTGIDLNRAGTPLLEIVSEPDMRSAKEAVAYARKIHSIVRHIGICDGNMQEGSFRCDANVSVRLAGGLYDADQDETRSMRSKEEANDYRYFPDPDLLPVEIDDELIASITASMPELPDVKKQRYIDELGLTEADANSLITDKTTADYFETVLAKASGTDPKLTANWILGELFARLNKDSLILENSPVDASAFAGLMQRLDDKTLSGKLGKQVLDAMWAGEGSADEVIEAKGLKQITDTKSQTRVKSRN